MGNFRQYANEFADELGELASQRDWRVRSTRIGETEGGAGTLTMTFVQALDGDNALTGTPMAGAANGTARTAEQQRDYDAAQAHMAGEVDQFGGFRAPRAHRPGAESAE